MQFEIETFSQAQAEAREGRENEDTLVVQENEGILVAAVFDGASSISSVTGKGKAITGRFAATTAAEAVRAQFSKAGDVRELAILANRAIGQKLGEQGIDADSASPLDVSQASGTIVRIDKHNRGMQVAQVGDTICLVVYEGGMVRKALKPDPEPYDEDAIALALELATAYGITLREAFIQPEISPKVEELMVKSRRCDNTSSAPSKGCGVFNGNSRMQKYLRNLNFDISKVDQVLLLTDGMWLPTTQFNAEPDWSRMVEILNQERLAGLYQEVLEMKSSDPDYVLYPRWKKHDDATGIRIRLHL